MTKEEYLALADLYDGRLGRPEIGDVFLMGCGVPNIYNGSNTNKNLLGGNRHILPYVWIAQENAPPCTRKTIEVAADPTLTKILSIDELATRIALDDVIEPINEASMYLTDGYILDIHGSHKRSGASREIPAGRVKTYYSDLASNPSNSVIPYEASDALDFLVRTVLGSERVNKETRNYLKLKSPHARLKVPDIYERYIDPQRRTSKKGIPAITSHDSFGDDELIDSSHIANGKRWVLKGIGRIVMPNGKYLIFNVQNGQVIDALSETCKVDGKRITKIDIKNPIFSDPTVDTWTLSVTDVSFYIEVSAGNEVYIPTNDEYTEEVLRETKFQIKDVVKNMDHSGLEDDEIGAAKRFLEEAIAILSKSKRNSSPKQPTAAQPPKQDVPSKSVEQNPPAPSPASKVTVPKVAMPEQLRKPSAKSTSPKTKKDSEHLIPINSKSR